jgi:hypothetical protein
MGVLMITAEVNTIKNTINPANVSAPDKNDNLNEKTSSSVFSFKKDNLYLNRIFFQKEEKSNFFFNSLRYKIIIQRRKDTKNLKPPPKRYFIFLKKAGG